jgi:hypothetical protein
METLHKERRFALMLGVDDAQGFILKYNTIVDKLVKLEQQYQKADPGFKMIDMWTCASTNGQVKFSTTRQCTDVDLKRKLLTIFDYMAK